MRRTLLLGQITSGVCLVALPENAGNKKVSIQIIFAPASAEKLTAMGERVDVVCIFRHPNPRQHGQSR